MWHLISEPWPWYIAGPLIAWTMLGLALMGKSFGISGTMRTMCAVGGLGRKIPFFDFNWRESRWALTFVLGIIIGSFIATQWLGNGAELVLSATTQTSLTELGVDLEPGQLAPSSLFSWEALQTGPGFILMVLGGFLVGFGARWAGGCTSGHAITGLSNLQLPSLLATLGFFIGGLIMTHLLLPVILG
ncbi:MAG: YeeE/YedE thiosulfate transporter family protein [Bacteroidota bacterium]